MSNSCTFCDCNTGIHFIVTFGITFTENLVLSDDAWKGPEWAFLTREERFVEGARKGSYFVRRIRELGLTDPTDIETFEK